MLPPDKTGLLKAFLGALPGHIAARLAMAVEVDRLMDGHVLPHTEILESLRPGLRANNKERTPTPLRLFCRPFHDLLTSTPRKAKRKAEIARASLTPVWSWIALHLLPEPSAAYVHGAREMLLAHKLDVAAMMAEEFWPRAAQAMRRALDDAAQRRLALETLGDPLILADAEEMALLLSAGRAIEKLQGMLHSPVPALTEHLLWDVRGVYDELARDQPDAAPYIAVITMNRLARPCEALRLPLLVTRHTDDVLISKTDMGLVGEILFARMEALKIAIEQTRHPAFDGAVLLKQLHHFVELSSGITREIELKRDGDWGRRLLADRAGVGKAMDAFMDRAPHEIAAAMPLLRHPGPRTADFSRHPGLEKQAMALRYARLLMGSRNIAAAASFAAKQKSATEEIAAELRRYVEDVIRALRTAEHRDVAEAQLELCVALTAILFSEEEAELLRRRGRAAHAASENAA